MYLSLFLSFVCGLPAHMILTQADGVRLTQCPEPPPGVTRPLSQDTMAVVSRPPMYKQARSLRPLETPGRSLGLVSSPLSCPWEVRPLLFSLWFCVIFSGLKAHARGEHNTLVLAGSVFLVPLRRWENRRAGLKDAGQLCSLWRVDWKETRAATSPAAHWLFAWSLCPGTNSPGEPASLLNLNVLENWNDYQVAHLRGLQEPQRGEPGRGQTRSSISALTPGRAMEPHSEKSTVTQRSPPQPQSPDIWALMFRCRHGVFQEEARPGLYPGLHVLVRRVQGQV